MGVPFPNLQSPPPQEGEGEAATQPPCHQLTLLPALLSCLHAVLPRVEGHGGVMSLCPLGYPLQKIPGYMAGSLYFYPLGERD